MEKNLFISLCGYVAIVILGVIASFGMFGTFGDVIRWLLTLIFVALFFWIGTKLSLLSNHFINYLSACGQLTITLPLAFLDLYFWNLLLVFPFPIFILDVEMGNAFGVPLVFIVATLLPSIIIWLGMVYQSFKKKRKAKQSLHNSAIT